MHTIQKFKFHIRKKIREVIDKEYNTEFSQIMDPFSLQGPSDIDFFSLQEPPDSEFGDFSFQTFTIATDVHKNAIEIAKNIANKIKPDEIIKSVESTGPYVNFKLQSKKLAQGVLGEVDKKYGEANLSKSKVLIEYATPNTHKAFHIGHLRNIITGESIARILANAGYKVIKVNYQGDVGMHVAKCIWGVTKLKSEFEKVAKLKDIDKRVEFLAKAYVKGSSSFEKSKTAQAEIKELNQRIYDNDELIRKIYKETRKWSLKYFDKIYQRVNTKFDKFYFESETFKPGKEIVLANLKKGIFKNSQGAIIFEGAKHGLHDRVFINSEGNPTYEAKDMALVKMQLEDYSPAKIFHVVSKEQTEYFKVIFKAMEYVLPKSKGKQEHLTYGWVNLKQGKMSSRLGNVVLGEWLLDEVKSEIKKIVAKNSDLKNKQDLTEKISLAAIKYSFLKTGIDRDISFDMAESINLSGNSGPYLQYTYARIQSILRKSEVGSKKSEVKDFSSIKDNEHKLILKLALFPEITAEAAEKYEPSLVAKYLFELSQQFNDYYHQVPILKAKSDEKAFRLAMIKSIVTVLDKGINLLGFETVERM